MDTNKKRSSPIELAQLLEQNGYKVYLAAYEEALQGQGSGFRAIRLLVSPECKLQTNEKSQ